MAAISDWSDDARRIFAEAAEMHGEMGVSFQAFLSRVLDCIEDSEADSAVTTNLRKLAPRYGADLYLSMACAADNEVAWQRFMHCYHQYMFNVAAFACRSPSMAEDVTSAVVIHLFTPDKTGRRRIGHYDGRSSLATWLRTIVTRRAADEVNLKFNSLESLDHVPVGSVIGGFASMEAEAQTAKYEQAIEESLSIAFGEMVEDERKLLCMRYDQSLQVSQIAKLYGVQPSTITRRIRSVQSGLKRRIALLLSSKFHLTETEIQECMAEASENHGRPILPYLRGVTMV